MIKHKAFIKVVELGSLTKAAKELGYSQPGISYMLSTLEEEMGFPLLRRTKDAIVPTENGIKILDCCYDLVKAQKILEETAQAINGVISGTLKIAALNSMAVNYVPPIISKFKDRFPQIEIHLEEFSIPDIHDMLQKMKCDIAFISKEFPKGCSFYPLFDDPLGVCMHQEHPLAEKDEVAISDLNACEFIMPLPGWDDLYDIVYKTEPFSPAISHYVASDRGAVAMVASNLGVSILPKLQAQCLPRNTTWRKFSANCARTLGYCITSMSHASPALRKFIAIINEKE